MDKVALDLTIKNENNKHTFKIFRKVTQTDHTIHNTSSHPFQHKIAAYNHMLHRLNNIPMNNEDYNEELNTITHIAIENGYTEQLIKNINRKIVNKINRHNLSTLSNNEDKCNNKKYISLAYNENTNKIVKDVFKSYGYTLANKTNNTILKNLREKSKTRDSGVYKLKCNDCTKFYIGQTGRTFTQRFNEHTKEVDHNHPKPNVKSNYAQHLNKERHTFTNIETNLQILHTMPKSKSLDRREEYEIYRERNNQDMLNDKINTKTNKLYDLISKL